MQELPVILPPGTVRLSYSRVSTFAEICELRYALDAVMPRTPSSKQQLQGTHVHDTFEAFVRRKLAGESWEDIHKDMLLSEIPGSLMEDRQLAYVKQIWPWLSSAEPASAEQWFECIAHPDTKETLPLVGKIDLICNNTPGLKEGDEDKPSVWDYKTTGRVENVKREWQIRKALQVITYALATGITRVGYAYVWPGKEPDVAYVDLDNEILCRVFDWYKVTAANIEKRWKDGGWGLAAIDHTLCSRKWCPHWDACQGGGNMDEYLKGRVK